jgi:hypothetical protein
VATLTLKTKSAAVMPAVPAAATPPICDEHFYFLWNPRRQRPRQRHPSITAALAERTRLIEVAPGEEFCLFEAQRLDI